MYNDCTTIIYGSNNKFFLIAMRDGACDVSFTK